MSSNFIFQNPFGYSWSFAFPCKFRIGMSIYAKKAAEFFIEIALNLQITLGSIYLVTVFSFVSMYMVYLSIYLGLP